MEYTEAKKGRIFVARLREGEEVYPAIESLAEKEKISAAVIWILGGVAEGKVVCGPQLPVTSPIQAISRTFEHPSELLGIGTLFPDTDGVPKLHLHSAIGRIEKIIVGCPREGLKTFLILEIIIQELTGADIARKPDPISGFKLLSLANPKIL